MSTKVTLATSLIAEFGLKDNRVNPPKKIISDQKLGKTLCERGEEIYHQSKALRTYLKNVWNNPMRAGCAAVTFSEGAANVYAGNIFTGVAQMVLGGKEVYNQCTDDGSSTLENLLNDIGADVDMIRTLEEGQQQSIKFVDENITLISNDVYTLYEKLEAIQNVNTKGLKSLEKSKQKAAEKVEKAKNAYHEVCTLINEAKESFVTSKASYEKCAQFFSDIQMGASDENGSLEDKLNHIVKAAKEAKKECNHGKKILDNADEKFSKAMQALATAQKLKDEAIELVSSALQKAEDTMHATSEKTKHARDSEKAINATKKELKEMQERSDDVMRLLDELTDELDRAKKEAAKKLDAADLVVGVGTSVLTAPLGPVTAVATGVTAAYAWHNRASIASATKRIYHFATGTPLPGAPAMDEKEQLRARFDKKSSGYFGWAMGRESHTVGTLDINFGDEVMMLPFDLNDKSYPVSKENLLTLYRRMFDKLKNKTLTPEKNDEILKQLENIEISRKKFAPDVKGIIQKHQAANGIVKALVKFSNTLRAASAA